MSDAEAHIAVVVPEHVFESLAARAAEIALARLGAAQPTGAYLTVVEAGEYLRAKPQRVYDLLSAGRLTRFKDGRRVLVSREELDRHIAKTPGSPIALALPPAPHSRISPGRAP